MDQSINYKGKLENWVCVFDDSNPKSIKAIGILIEHDKSEERAIPVVTSNIVSISDGVLKTLDSCFCLGVPKYSEISQMIDYKNDFGNLIQLN